MGHSLPVFVFKLGNLHEVIVNRRRLEECPSFRFATAYICKFLYVICWLRKPAKLCKFLRIREGVDCRNAEMRAPQILPCPSLPVLNFLPVADGDCEFAATKS